MIRLSINELNTNITIRSENAKDRLIRAARRRKQAQIVRNLDLEIGSKVFVKKLRVSNLEAKVAAKFVNIYEGPYKVVNRKGRNTYVIDVKDKCHNNSTYNICDIAPYYERTNESV